MNLRIPYPMIRLFVALAAGIATAIITRGPFRIPHWLFLLFLAMTALYVFWLARLISYRTRWIFGFLFFLFLFVFGYEWTLVRTGSNNPDHYLHLERPGKFTVVRLTSPAKHGQKSIKAEAAFMMSGDSSGWKKCSGQLMLYFEIDSMSTSLQYGDVILFNAIPETMTDDPNPGTFDYRTYLERKGIYHSIYLRASSWRSAGVSMTNLVYALSYRLSDHVLRLLKENGLKEREFAVSAALLAGNKEYLDTETMQNYSGTGAMHILSVSGLHVGLVFVVLHYLLFFLDRNQRTRVAKAILVILAIWMYALITGMSPSVQRAALMFSLISVSKITGRTADMYNSIAVSAFILLIANPYFITHMGFQLSYLAVIGIIRFQPVLVSWWKPRWWLTRQLWGIISVSLAAQLGTFPISIYYFHQFPNYFILTNIVALPLATFIMYLGVAVVGFSFIPSISSLLAKLLDLLIFSLNYGIGFIEDLPGSVSRGLYLTLAETCLLYLLIISMAWLWKSRSKASVFAAVVLTCLLFVSLDVRKIRTATQSYLCVYAVRNTTAIDLVSSSNRYLIADADFIADAEKVRRTSGGWMDRLGVRSYQAAVIGRDSLCDMQAGCCLKGKYLKFKELTLALADHVPATDNTIKIDYLLVRGKSSLCMADLLRVYRPRLLIIDGCNSRYKAEKWRQECVELGLPCWSIPHQGAFIKKIEGSS